MNTQYNARILAEAVPIVAAAYGKKFGVKIVFKGDQAKTDGKTIVLPSLPPNNSNNDVLWGYLTHEAGHVRFTDWKFVPTAPNRQSMLNVVEDARIELAMMRVYPGTMTTLNAVADHMARKGHYVLQSAENEPYDILFSYCLCNLQCNVVGQQGLKEFWLAAEQAFTQVFPASTRGKLDLLLQRVVDLKNTEQALNLADQILELLKQEACCPEANDNASSQQENSSGGENAASTADGTDPNNPLDSDVQSDGSTERTDGTSSSAKGDQLTDSLRHGAAGEVEGAEGEPNKPTSGEGAKDQSEAQERLLQALNEGEFKSFDPRSKLRSELFENSNHTEEQVLSVPVAISIPTNAEANTIWNRRANSAASGIRHRLSGLVQAKRRSGSISATIGKRIHAPDIHRVCTGDTKVFRKTWTEKKPDTAVHILIDNSSSMKRPDLEMPAKEAALALGVALEGIPKVNPAITLFGDSFARPVYPVLKHGERASEKLGKADLSPSGNTPMAQAIWYALFELSQQRCNRAIMIIVTDGRPSNSQATRDALELAKRSGVEVSGIGINSGDISRYIENSVIISTVYDLKSVLFGLMKNQL
ncbi:VWA domain-containing protein [Pseudovibrio sp. Ad37]|uniref:VWA domain-containing protein n=1 Tax=Pseudovibrio sp. Ad37 TaxID=989422 RepID=UPI0007B29D6D|nr:VWA domain-containing protein [Pseudovibrio sp. Ad37]KZL22668.1 von Willebrand factor type A domain protein [Pseudovibrio sp. Ad37]